MTEMTTVHAVDHHTAKLNGTWLYRAAAAQEPGVIYRCHVYPDLPGGTAQPSEGETLRCGPCHHERRSVLRAQRRGRGLRRTAAGDLRGVRIQHQRHQHQPSVHHSLGTHNRGYVSESAIHNGPYNYFKNWDYAGLIDAWNAEDGHGLGLTATTGGELDCTESVRLEGLPQRGQVALQAVLAQPAAAAIPPRITLPLGTRGRQASDEGVYERASRTAADTEQV